VNARAVAEQRGIEVRESLRGAGDYVNLIRVATSPDVRASGTTIGRDNRPWLVKALGYEVEIELAGPMLFLLNDDRPGMIGRIGTVLGDERVNIANMNVSRNREGGRALCAVQTDEMVPPELVERLEAIEGIERIRTVRLDG
jgi:D-3-phosphoglycerate dehydrogenase